MNVYDLWVTDALLTTTRAVRKRLDLKRPVPESVIRECLEILGGVVLAGFEER